MKKKLRCTFEEIEGPNEDGFYEVHLNLDDHGDCITVIGKGLDEAIDRAVTVQRAFNE